MIESETNIADAPKPKAKHAASKKGNQLHRQLLFAERTKVRCLCGRPSFCSELTDHVGGGAIAECDSFFQRSVFRQPPTGCDRPVGLGCHFSLLSTNARNVLSLGRGQGLDESTGQLELRDVLAGFDQRTGLRE